MRFFFFSSRRRHTRCSRDWSSDVCSSDLGAFAAEASVAIESNPYVYRVVPGKEQEVFLPLMILTARGLQKVMERENMLTKEEKDALDSVLLTAEKLLAGHPVGPGRMGSSSSKESS